MATVKEVIESDKPFTYEQVEYAANKLGVKLPVNFDRSQRANPAHIEMKLQLILSAFIATYGLNAEVY